MPNFIVPHPTISSLRIPPHSVQAERSLLGALMIDNTTWDQVADRVNEQDFYRREHQLIFQAIAQLADDHQPFDVITLSETLDQRRLLSEVGGLAYLGSLAKDTPSAANITAYAAIVREHAILRRLVSVGTTIADQGYRPDGRNAMALVDDAERRVFEIADQMTHGRGGFRHIKPLLVQAVNRVEALFGQDDPFTGLVSGFTDFDRLTSGLQVSDLIVVAGRPAMGKCLVGTTRIVDPNTGALDPLSARIERRHGDLLTLNAQGRLLPRKAHQFLDDGIKPVFQVTTELGRRVTCTLSHPFLTTHGWQPLAHLQVGTTIGIPCRLPVRGDQVLTATALTGLIDSALTSVASLPAAVFRLPLHQLAVLLKHCLAASQWETLPSLSVYWSITNEAQVRDLVHLLLRFGILARMVPRPVIPTWELRIQHPESLRLLIREIGVNCLDDAVIDLISTLDRQDLLKTASSCDFIWDPIITIHALGMQQVYDLTVPDGHNFIADDVCVHNTSYAMNIAEHVAMTTQRPVAVFSMEMTAEALAMRLMSSLGRIDLQRIRSGKLADEEWPRLTRAVSLLSQTRLFIDDTRGLNPTELRARARRLKHEQGDLALIVIDYLQLMEVPGRTENRVTEISLISRSLKSLAGELNVPVIALSQLNRGLENRPNKRPLMSDLRESGAIEQDADLIIFIYRDEVYNKESSDNGTAEIIISKQRNGPTGTVRLTFLNQYTRFENYVDNVYHTDGSMR